MECMICLEKTNPTKINYSCGCKVNIHDKCFNQWNNNHRGECPLCRSSSSPLKIQMPIRIKEGLSFRKRIYIFGIICACVILMCVMIL